MRVVAIIQCRISSTRLPAKAALDLLGKPMLARVIERCRMSKRLSGVIVATSDHREDDCVETLAEASGVPVFRGSLDDARSRLLGAALTSESDAFVRITADNPFVEPAFIDELIATKEAHPNCPYAVHDLDAVVYGTASELVDTARFDELVRSSALPDTGREHVTSGLADLDGARILCPGESLSDPKLSLTVDTLDQYLAAWAAMRTYGNGPEALPLIISAFRENPGGPQPFVTRG